ncbi:MAG: hypothetical protein CMK09_15130 [Ponticaulis sp.]|nr:hypothetical protein [Ponticaulis sp.]
MDMMDIMRAFSALALVLGLILAMWWGFRRFSNMTPNSPLSDDLKVVSWRPFDGRKKLAVIRWGDEEHLVLTGQAGDLHISSRKAKQDVPTESGEET